MGGKGELVTYKRWGPTTTEIERAKLRQEIADFIDQTATTITIIALVEVEDDAKALAGAKHNREKPKAPP
jgi:hypothetical protein